MVFWCLLTVFRMPLTHGSGAERLFHRQLLLPTVGVALCLPVNRRKLKTRGSRVPKNCVVDRRGVWGKCGPLTKTQALTNQWKTRKLFDIFSLVCKHVRMERRCGLHVTLKGQTHDPQYA